jgi:hypothetical protein
MKFPKKMDRTEPKTGSNRTGSVKIGFLGLKPENLITSASTQKKGEKKKICEQIICYTHSRSLPEYTKQICRTRKLYKLREIISGGRQ